MGDRNESVKCLGCYLIEAGLITQAQVEVALNDQKIMDDMRFGEVLVARGWMKQQTLDYLIRKIVEPEQRAAKALQQKSLSPDVSPSIKIVNPTPPEATAKPSSVMQNERKSLPSLPADDGVSWAG